MRPTIVPSRTKRDAIGAPTAGEREAPTRRGKPSPKPGATIPQRQPTTSCRDPEQDESRRALRRRTSPRQRCPVMRAPRSSPIPPILSEGHAAIIGATHTTSTAAKASRAALFRQAQGRGPTLRIPHLVVPSRNALLRHEPSAWRDGSLTQSVEASPCATRPCTPARPAPSQLERRRECRPRTPVRDDVRRARVAR